jgi:hypothetical protein
MDRTGASTDDSSDNYENNNVGHKPDNNIEGVDQDKNNMKNALEDNIEIMDQANNDELDFRLEIMADDVELMANEEPTTQRTNKAKGTKETLPGRRC